MVEQRRGNHTITRLTVQLVWVTKYRYRVLKGEIQQRCRELIMQICDAEDVRILPGAVSKDQVHMQIEYPPSKSGMATIRVIRYHKGLKCQHSKAFRDRILTGLIDTLRT